ncbi:DUF445 domain-containing protein [Clostridium sp. WILCCON 0269]|uniref:DUF445 domain-containing protein n=1 Tax=Candidatus Clostridium eludens TaxID=3381663 RepID=A0ABW8SFN9_9CLOT
MKNKKIADRLLIILFITFCISVLLKMHFDNNFYVKMFNFVIEAALVGSIADWFAVTALFEKPLGFSWHTAVIPRNRVKVVNAIVDMVENELFSKKILKEKIDQLDIVNSIIEFVEDSAANRAVFYIQLEKFIENIIGSIDASTTALFIEKKFKDNLRDGNLSLYFSKILEFAIKNEYCKMLFKALVEELAVKIKKEKTKQEISKIINKIIKDNINKVGRFKKVLMELALGVARGTNTINVDDIAFSIQEQIAEMLNKLKDEEQPIHIEFINKIETTIEKLHKDEKLINDIERWKQDTIAKITVQEELGEIIESIFAALKYEIKKEVLQEQHKPSEKTQLYVHNILPLIDWAKDELHNYWENFKNDDEFKSVIEKHIKEVIYKLVKSSYGIIGTIIKKVLNNMTDETLNNFIQLKAGNELNWIRINGCIIGAIFGFVVFIFINQVYLPLITKIFHL